MNMKRKYTKQLLSKLAAESFTVADILRKLELKQTGCNNAHIKRRLVEYQIDISHFLGSAANCGKNHKGRTKRVSKDILVQSPNGSYRQKPLLLRRALIEIGRPYKCEICNLSDKWNNQEIRLEVDHKNNDWLDNRSENLRFLCPNCHSQQKHAMNQGHTELTSIAKYGRINLRRKRNLPHDHVFRNKYAVKIKQKFCLDCDKKISTNAIRCKSCTTKLRGTKIEWPSIEELKVMLATNSYCEVGRKLGVSDNAIRKRLRVHDHVA
jgi:hypothetical protein